MLSISSALLTIHALAEELNKLKGEGEACFLLGVERDNKGHMFVVIEGVSKLPFQRRLPFDALSSAKGAEVFLSTYRHATQTLHANGAK